MNNTNLKPISFVILCTIILLLIPFTAMQLTNEVNWSPLDFTVAGILLLVTGFFYVFVTRKSDDIKQKLAFGIAIITSLLIIWVNLAVGIIGDGNNPANLMYVGVIVIGIIGSFIVKFKKEKMAKVLFATAGVHLLVALITLLAGFSLPSSENSKILLFNCFIIGLWLISGMLFRKAKYGLVSA